MEANKYAFHVTGHKCDQPDASGKYHNCDRGGQCTMDIITDTNIQSTYGPFIERQINTELPFHVKTEFHQTGTQFTGYTTTLTQGDQQVQMSTGDCQYLQ